MKHTFVTLTEKMATDWMFRYTANVVCGEWKISRWTFYGTLNWRV